MTSTLVVGGTGGLGSVIAGHFADRGDDVIITSRDKTRAETVAARIGGGTRGLTLDLAAPETISASLAEVTDVDHLVITAIGQAANSLAQFSIADAVAAVTMKLIGYTETVRVLRDRFTVDASVVLVGGLAKERPYPGSTIVTTFNAGITGLVKTLAVEIAPHRVNALHPGLIGDSPRWRDVPNPPHSDRTPIGRLVTMAEIADATDFLLRNTGINAHDPARGRRVAGHLTPHPRLPILGHVARRRLRATFGCPRVTDGEGSRLRSNLADSSRTRRTAARGTSSAAAMARTEITAAIRNARTNPTCVGPPDGAGADSDHGGGSRGPECGADGAGDGVQTGGDADLGLADGVHGHVGQRREGQAHAQTQDGPTRGQVPRVVVDQGESAESEGDQGIACQERHPEPEAGPDPRRPVGGQYLAHGVGQQQQTGGGRGEAEPEAGVIRHLRELRYGEEPGEQREPDQERAEVRRPHRLAPEQLQGHQWSGTPAFDPHPADE
jgi:NAD(P)-dependent dehydrogenase (short-subunit alcohol dehydrogenase family)